VRGPHTSDAALHATCALARRLGRMPVVVADRAGRVVYRLLVSYLHEAMRLRAEGADAAQVDAAMLRFGMPAGPLRLYAELGAEFVERVARELHERLGSRFAPPPPRPAVPTRRPGVVGLLQGVTAGVWSRLGRGERRRDGERNADAILAGLQERLLLILLNEAAHILDDGVVDGALEVDRAVTLSIGFPPTRGGLLFHADRVGAAVLVRTLLELQARHGPRFAPAPLLCRLAADDAGFYTPRRDPGSGQPARQVLT
jgi:3-hydroxyacyl-CoA dehydrogenase / enoyl-CoA hydratase / 3-hydroxybutyryl-CoA epimerase